MTHSFLTLGFIAYDDVYITIGVYIFAERCYVHVQLYFKYERVKSSEIMWNHVGTMTVVQHTKCACMFI